MLRIIIRGLENQANYYILKKEEGDKKVVKMFMKKQNSKKTNLLTRILHDKKGIYVTTAMKIVIALVLGITTLTGTTYVMKDVVMPQTESKIVEEFNKDYSVESGETGGSGGDTESTRNNVIPSGGMYTSGSETFTEGDSFPVSPSSGDTYVEGDYRYSYNLGGDYGTEWSVKVIDQDKSTYGTILSEIAGKPMTNMYFTFDGCASLTSAPVIPDGVTSLYCAFAWCSSLSVAPVIPDSVTNMYGALEYTAIETAPVIPSGVTNMSGTFIQCLNLRDAPIIPSSVNDMSWTFAGCSSLSDSVEVNANPSVYTDCFAQTPVIEITGTCSQETKDALLGTNV